MTDLSDITAEDVRRYLRSEGWEQGHTEPCFEGWHRVGRWLLIRRDVEDDLRRLARRQERPLAAIAADVRRLRDEAARARFAAAVADLPDLDTSALAGSVAPPEPAADVARIPALPLGPDVDDAVEALVRQHDRSGDLDGERLRHEDGEDWVGCLHDRPHQDPGRARPARTVRRERDEERPAADVRTVRACGLCPAAQVSDGWDICHLAGHRSLPESAFGGGSPPAWCPLRRGPVTLRLEVE